MEANSFCCGQTPSRKKRINEKELPENPTIDSGIEVIYLGAGDFKLEENISRQVYYGSNSRRRFTVDPNDVASILAMPDFILHP